MTTIFVTSAHRLPLIDFGDLVTYKKGTLTGLGRTEANQFGKRVSNITAAYSSPVSRCVDTMKCILEGSNQSLPIQVSTTLTNIPEHLPEITDDGLSALALASQYVSTTELSKGSGAIVELGELYYYRTIEGLDYVKLDSLRTKALNDVIKPIDLSQFICKEGVTICCVPELTLFALAKHFSSKDVSLPHSLSYLQIEGDKVYYDGVRLSID